MFLLSKIAWRSLAVFVLAGCATSNFVSSSNFELYVPEKYYEVQTCSKLRTMQKEFRLNPSAATRLHLGLDIYPHPIAQSVFVQMGTQHGSRINRAIKDQC